MIPKITKEKLDKFYKLSDELTAITRMVNERHLTVKDNEGKKKVKIFRDGKNIDVTVDDLFNEFRYGSKDAKNELEKLYPDLIKLSDQHNKKLAELNSHTVQVLGFSFEEMTMRRLLDLIQGLLNFKFEEVKGELKEEIYKDLKK